jgi:hypothetical protein
VVEKNDFDERAVYQIRMQGKLDERWSDWFGGLAVAVENEIGNPPVTTLVGSIDQAALRGILCKLWDLNLTLISVRRVEADDGERKEEGTK